MEVRYLILARYAEFAPDGTLNLIGGDHDKIIADDYPYLHPQLVAGARVVLNREDCTVEHQFRSIIINDDTKEWVAEGASGILPVFVMPAGVDFLGTGMVLGFQNIIFPSEGAYITQLFIDDGVRATARFRVAPAAYFRARQKSIQTLKEDSPNV